MNYSMFVQPFGLTDESLRVMLDHVVRVNDTDGGHHISNLVIEHIATKTGEPVWDTLDTILEYAHHFANLFVGTSGVPYEGSKYREGVMDSDNRTRQIIRTAELAEAFRDRYAGEVFYHHYIGYEGVLDWWMNEDVRAGYEDLLTGFVTVSNEVLGNRSIMYAPAYWSLNPPTGISWQIQRTFRNIRMRAGSINWLMFQDMYGRKDSWLNPTPENTLAWYRAIRAADAGFSVIRVVPEAFEHSPDGLVPYDPELWLGRLDAYQRLGIPMGPVFELRYWYEIERRLRRPGEDPIRSDPVTDKPFNRVQTFHPGDDEWPMLEGVAPGAVEVTVVSLHDG